METALRYELVNTIPELDNQVFPTNAPEGADKPYLVYMRTGTDLLKTLQGYTGDEYLSFVFNVMAVRYSDMSRIRKEVQTMLMDFPSTTIGNTKKYHVEEITINNIDEQFEHQLKVNRGIVDFTIYFKKGD